MLHLNMGQTIVSEVMLIVPEKSGWFFFFVVFFKVKYLLIVEYQKIFIFLMLELTIC